MLKPSPSRSSVAMLLMLPARLQLVIITQFLFNVGFYLVVPFLAAHLLENLMMAAWVVGLILGMRTFSQQGLFFVGGALADRFGIKKAVLIGCVIRICGFLVLSVATEVFGVMLGVVLVGLAAALFSPAVESAIVAWAGEVENAGGPTQEEIIGLELMASKMGTIVGPLVGAVILVIPFQLTCLVGAGVFTLVLVAQLIWLPAGSRTGEPAPIRESVMTVLRNRRFLLFAVIHSSYLLSYNQFYLAIPIELERIGVPGGAITWLFALAAVLTLALQLPLTRAVMHWPSSSVLGLGYALIASGFASMAIFVIMPPLPGLWAFLPAALFVTGLHIGQIFVMPAARTVVARLGQGQRLGSYLGMLASMGGLAVLLGSTGIGLILPWAKVTQPMAAVPWLILALIPVISSAAAVIFCRRHVDSKKKGHQ